MDCPNCHTDVEVLEKNYGSLFTCTQCQAVYFINFEGQAEYSEMNESELQIATEDIVVHHNEFLTDAVADEVAGADPLMSAFENPMSAFEQSSYLSTEVQPENPSEFSSVAKEISDFGNSDAQIASLNYDVEITGLDSKEEVGAFKEAIEDHRFGWDVPKILQSLRNGSLKIEKLNPVQAYILSRRIRFLNIEVKWKQNVLA